MPFVDLPHENVRMFYRTNLPGGEFGGAVTPTTLVKDRQILLLLPGTMIDSGDMVEIFKSPLSKIFTLIALDPRSVGQTKNIPMLTRDSWTDAVDFIKAMDALGIKEFHVFAVSGSSIPAAKRMGMMWPEKVKSLVFAAASSPDPPEWIQESWKELLDTYLHATNIETMEECINDYYPLAYGEYLSESRVDDVVRYWETQYYPANGARFYDWAIPFLLWQRLGPEFLELINQPVLILNGDSTLVSSPEEAELLRSGLVNAAGGAKLVIVEEAPDQFHFIPQFAAILIKEMMSFYCTLPKFQVRSFTNKERDHLKRALFEIADLRNDPAMKRRDPHQAASFSCVSAEVIETRKRAYQGIAQKDGKAFSPFGPKGELPRKFSERHLGDIAEAAQRSRARSDSGLWAGGVEQEEVESDEESDSRTATEGLGKKLAKFLRIGRSPRPQA